jgi:hypothetical protein
MKLYHYSDSQYAQLQSRRVSGLPVPEGVRVSDDYLDHISFFFTPIPSKLMPDIFYKGHPFWYKGHKLYEHVIEVDDLEDEFNFRVVESERKTALLDEFSKEHDWETHDPKKFALWKAELFKMQKKYGEIGFNKAAFKTFLKTLPRDVTRYGYLAAKARDDFDWGYNKYAANVPHVMLYPRTGIVAVKEVSELTIGNDHRKKVV